ncbi:alpha/beta hydrolase family protein [Acanthopleuribacter pedis]|uniref:Acetyl xylan esterase domain-containing protein n=1 Tax=Acanthopleuribacter pedis TaxID=442870 RepID=A0A8J7U391_9BACT|nr:hypothetical protein [Acanthopleuribacter pedis]MBO1319382.1 hypothetical protein [Acanthopleuribacter pedis]
MAVPLLKSRRFWKWFLLAPLCLTVLGFLGLWAWLTPRGLPLFGEPRDYFMERKGTVAAAPAVKSIVEEGRAPVSHVRLASDSGLVVDLAVRRPEHRPQQGLPLVLLVGGYRTGKNAVHLAADGNGMVLAAIDYPLPGARTLKGFRAVAALPQIRGAIYDTPPALMLALDYLITLPEVDPARIELVGVSMGAPLVCVAGALDARFTRVWAVQGGGDPFALFYHLLERKIPSAPPRYLAARIIERLLLTISPERWVAEISPRPFVLVTAADDERIPKSCADLVFDSAREPRKRIDLPGEHIQPEHGEMIDRLFQMLRDHMEPPPSPE